MIEVHKLNAQANVQAPNYNPPQMIYPRSKATFTFWNVFKGEKYFAKRRCI